ncbi:MAG: hypothetical protein ISS33_01795 [Candidatus Omnitrophica bacterium]|nr:hypothetical protein [Candidatus Omnitrophota bacterium]
MSYVVYRMSKEIPATGGTASGGIFAIYDIPYTIYGTWYTDYYDQHN